MLSLRTCPAAADIFCAVGDPPVVEFAVLFASCCCFHVEVARSLVKRGKRDARLAVHEFKMSLPKDWWHVVAISKRSQSERLVGMVVKTPNHVEHISSGPAAETTKALDPIVG
jgi:hypothetical protein